MLSLISREARGIADPQESPEQKAIRAQIRSILSRGIGGLTEKQSAVLTLYYRDELQFSRIAALLGVSAAAVSRTHARALCGLKSQLETKGIERYRDAA